MHNAAATNLGKIGVLVALEGNAPADVLEPLGKQIGMHIAAAFPLALSAEGLDASLIERERKIAAEKAAESGKPEAVQAKMIEGAVQKYLKEVSLFNQVFVKAADGKQTVEQYLKSANTEVKGFTMFTVGEGIEKKQEDFAAEVAATLAAAKGQ